MGGTPPPLGARLILGAVSPPPLGAGTTIDFSGFTLSIGQVLAPPGSDPGGIDYEEWSALVVSRIREALRASGQLGVF